MHSSIFRYRNSDLGRGGNYTSLLSQDGSSTISEVLLKKVCPDLKDMLDFELSYPEMLFVTSVLTVRFKSINNNTVSIFIPCIIHV